MIMNKSTKRPLFESSDSEPEIIYQNTPAYMVIQSTEDIPITKISPFKIEQILFDISLPGIYLIKVAEWFGYSNV